LSITDKFYAVLFSDISLGIVIPIVIGILILLFPTVISDYLETVHVSFPEFIWGGPEIPLQYIITIGITEGILTCAIPVTLGIAWNRWAGGASGFLTSILFTVSMAAYYGTGEWGFVPTLDWLGVIVAGMLAGYIAGSVMTMMRMKGRSGLKGMLIAGMVATTVATIITTQTYIMFSPMYSMSMDLGMNYWDAWGLTWFTYIAIYYVWALFGVIGAWVSFWFR